MSMHTDCIYGYGFKVYVSDENLRDFIKKHESTIVSLSQGRELVDWTNEHISTGKPLDSLKEEFYDWDNLITGDSGLYGMIADVMTKETGIRFEFRNPQEDGEDDVILFPQTYPWYLNEQEKALTEETLDDIYAVYIGDLGGQLTTEYIRIEYYG